jgi:hypothetical protein
MFNKFMSLGTIPDGWRKSIIKILYNGKEDLSDLDSYKGIALECTPFKVFRRLLTQRLTILNARHAIRRQKRQIDVPSCTQPAK